MKRAFVVLLVVVGTLGLAAVAADDPPLFEEGPASARLTKARNLKELEERYGDAIEELQEAFDDRARELGEARLGQLRRLLDEAMERKDVDATTKTQSLIDEAERELDVRPSSQQGKTARAVGTAKALRRHLVGTKWEWSAEALQFLSDGTVRHPGWQSRGLVTTWEAIDRRTAILRIARGRNVNLHAILTFSDDLTSYDAIDFEGNPHGDNKRLRD